MSAFGGKADIEISGRGVLLGLFGYCFACQPNCKEGDATSDKRGRIVVGPTPVNICRHHGEEN